MAIKPCKECGGPVSEKAEQCPLCGAKQPKKTSPFVMFLAVLLGGAALIAMVTPKSENNQKVSTSVSETQTSVEASNWLYETKKDEMRGIETKFALTQSMNTVKFDFPYNGGSKLLLTIRKKGNDQDVMLAISKGQFICGIQKCEVIFKFDDKPLKSVTMVGSDTHQSDTLFVAFDKTESEIINQIKSSNKLVVEVKFYQEGSKQFTFNVSNLNW